MHRALSILLAAVACTPTTSLEVAGAPELVSAFYVQDPDSEDSDTLTEVWLTLSDDGCERFSRIASRLARGHVDDATAMWVDEMPEDTWYFVAALRSGPLLDGDQLEGTSDTPPRAAGQVQGTLVNVSGTPDLTHGLPLDGSVTEGGTLTVERARTERLSGTFETFLDGAPLVASFDAMWCRAVEEPRFR